MAPSDQDHVKELLRSPAAQVTWENRTKYPGYKLTKEGLIRTSTEDTLIARRALSIHRKKKRRRENGPR